MEYVIRDASVITGKKNLEPLHTFKDYPVFFGCVDHGPEKDVRVDMSWAICPESGVVQLDKLVPLDILYQEQHVDGTGPTWERYYEDFANYIARQNPTRVLEIGGGAGTLARLVTEKLPDTTWTVIEPNPLIPETDQIKVLSGFFDEQFEYDQPIDTIVFSQVLEHAYDPQEFVRSIARFLKPGQRLICAYPNLTEWLKNKFTNAINFEHSMLLTDYFVDYLLQKYGFEIADKYFYGDHSVYYTAIRSEDVADPTYDNQYEEYKKLFLDYVRYYEDLAHDLNQKIEAFDGEVYVFGAHIFAQHLFQTGLQEDKVTAILDNSPIKTGKRLYGTNLHVEKPEVLRGKKAAVILKVGVHRDDILKQLHEINSDIVIFE